MAVILTSLFEAISFAWSRDKVNWNEAVWNLLEPLFGSEVGGIILAWIS